MKGKWKANHGRDTDEETNLDLVAMVIGPVQDITVVYEQDQLLHVSRCNTLHFATVIYLSFTWEKVRAHFWSMAPCVTLKHLQYPL